MLVKSAAVCVVLIVGLCAAPPAHAANPACGDTIMVSTKLEGDIGPCPGVGLTVGADEITLDLRGFRIFGSTTNGTFGISLSGRTGVTVKNGTVGGFATGVRVFGGSANTVAKMRVVGNIGNGTSSGDGVLLDSSSSNVVSKNVVRGNGPLGGITVLGGSTDDVIKSNVVDGNAMHNVANDVTETQGIRIENGSVGTKVLENKVTDSGLDGIAVFAQADGVLVKGNTVSGNGYHAVGHRLGDGISVFGVAGTESHVIAKNKVFDNAASGIRVRANADDVTVKKNKVKSNALHDTAQFDLHDDNACVGNMWTKNKAKTKNDPCIA